MVSGALSHADETVLQCLQVSKCTRGRLWKTQRTLRNNRYLWEDRTSWMRVAVIAKGFEDIKTATTLGRIHC
jgi:hypothetical protein